MLEEKHLEETIESFITGDLELFGDPVSPPWTRPGIISQVSKDYYQRTTENSHLAVECFGTEVKLTTPSVGQTSLAYEEFGAYFVRDLTVAEHAELHSLLRQRNHAEQNMKPTQDEIDKAVLSRTPGNFQWDEWQAKAIEAGVADDLAGLGRAVMREAYQHNWGDALKRQCGWLDEGELMIEEALEDPEEAKRIWEILLRTDGYRTTK